ncbi:UNVERIFIED_CONTAM: hypothetical protein PYX00_000764 [Menopon gallinae]|uniref:GPR158/179 extracellular domain-containing protein n=1 Tax=Menopon gallinae TaxID=328185 RepID=A0AAW2IAF8_9NEOP
MDFYRLFFRRGTSGIDIDLRRVDIDQCPLPPGNVALNIFAGSDKCKKETTMCEPISGLGFRRGSYKCLCKKGYYHPDTKSEHRYYNGTVVEDEYEKFTMVCILVCENGKTHEKWVRTRKLLTPPPPLEWSVGL